MEEQVVDEEELWNGLKKALHGATERFVETRILEGKHLKEDIVSKLDKMSELLAYIEERSPKIVAEYRKKLESKVKELLVETQIEEGRIAAEVVIFADKICTDEEIVRLKPYCTYERNSVVR